MFGIDLVILHSCRGARPCAPTYVPHLGGNCYHYLRFVIISIFIASSIGTGRDEKETKLDKNGLKRRQNYRYSVRH
jgi:hypothetical protein